MSVCVQSSVCLTVADLVERFGPLPLCRLRVPPTLGTATEQDVFDFYAREKLLCELVDGLLVEKTMGFYESHLAALLIQFLGNHVRQQDLGILAAPDGMMRLAPGLVRIPDVSFIAWERLPQRQVPREAIPDLVPDLAVEVLSESNTAKEMQRKLEDYFAAGVRLVWYVDPDRRCVQVYTGVDQVRVVNRNETLTGEPVLPGFSLSLRELFPAPPRSAQVDQ